jgi:DNA-binding response OmpR family regulator
MNHQLIKILLIEDNPGDAMLIEETLGDAKAARFNVTVARDLTMGLNLLIEPNQQPDVTQSTISNHQSNGPLFDIILLDLSLPDSDGLETFQKVEKLSQDIPIIILSGTDNETLATEAVQGGAQDYLVKGQIESNMLARSIRYAIERKRIREELRIAREQDRHELEAALASQKDLMGWQKGSVAAQISGVGPLHMRDQEIFTKLQSAYESLLDKYLDSLSFHQRPPRQEIGELANRIGHQAGGPRDVIELHRQAILVKSLNISPQQVKTYAIEGRLLALEVMGYLVDYYRGRNNK